MLTDIKALLFDLDGTLVDSMWVWKNIDVEYLGRFNIKYDLGLQERIGGKSFYETAVLFKQYYGLEDSIDTIMSDWNDMAFDKYSNEVPLKDGAYELLTYCRENGIKCAIATSNSRRLCEAVCSNNKVLKLIDCIVTSDEVKNGKPAPDVYLQAAKKLSVSPKNCLVFEDILPGMRAGRNAGMKVCAVEDIYSYEASDKAMEFADYYIKSFKEVMGL